MVAETKTSVKARFQSGDEPNEQDFINLIDSYQDANSTLDTIITAVSGNSVANVPIVTDGAGGIQSTAALVLTKLTATNVSASVVVSNLGTFTTVSANDVIASAGTFTRLSATTVSADTITVSATLKAGSITDHHFFFRATPAVGTESFVPDTPYAYTAVGVRTFIASGSTKINLRKNGTTFHTVEVTAALSAALASAQSFSVGDTLDVVISASDADVSALSIYVQFTRAL